MPSTAGNTVENGSVAKVRGNLILLIKWAMATRKPLDFFVPTSEEFKWHPRLVSFYDRYYERKDVALWALKKIDGEKFYIV